MSMFYGSYKRLAPWRQSLGLVRAAYALARRFPTTEQGSLAAMIKRAALSIPARIADAHGQDDEAGFRKALAGVDEALREIDTYLSIAQSLGFVSWMRAYPLRRRASRVGKAVDRWIMIVEEAMVEAEAAEGVDGGGDERAATVGFASRLGLPRKLGSSLSHGATAHLH